MILSWSLKLFAQSHYLTKFCSSFKPWWASMIVRWHESAKFCMNIRCRIYFLVKQNGCQVVTEHPAHLPLVWQPICCLDYEGFHHFALPIHFDCVVILLSKLFSSVASFVFAVSGYEATMRWKKVCPCISKTYFCLSETVFWIWYVIFRNVCEYVMAQQREKGKSKSGKSESVSLQQQLQAANDEYEEEARLCVFRLKSLKQGQYRSLLTQAARHHAAQVISFVSRKVNCLDFSLCISQILICFLGFFAFCTLCSWISLGKDLNHLRQLTLMLDWLLKGNI